MDQEQMDRLRDRIIRALEAAGFDADRDEDAGDAVGVYIDGDDFVLTIEPV